MNELHVFRNDNCFNIDFDIDFQIYYHTFSLMINVTHVLRILTILNIKIFAKIYFVFENVKIQNVIEHFK